MVGEGKHRPDGPIDMEPMAKTLAKVGDGAQRIHGAPHRGAGRSHHGNDGTALVGEGLQGLLEGHRLHRPLLIHRQPDERLRGQTHHCQGLEQREMGIVAAEHHPITVGGQTGPLAGHH